MSVLIHLVRVFGSAALWVLRQLMGPQAMEIQCRILKRAPLEQPEMIPSQKQLAGTICVRCGEHYTSEKDYAKAERKYKDALSYVPTDNKVASASTPPTPELWPPALAPLQLVTAIHGIWANMGVGGSSTKSQHPFRLLLPVVPPEVG